MRNHLYLFAGGALFRGPVRDNQAHRHNALQIVVSPRPFRIGVADSEFETRCILIAPDVEHALAGDDRLQSLLLLERESTAAEALIDRLLETRSYYLPETAGVEFDFETERLAPACAAAIVHRRELLERFFGFSDPGGSGDRDPRIQRLCEHVAGAEDFRVSLSEAASVAGLSEGRLTHLFKAEVGVPLRRYIAWLRIRKAVASVANGDSLTTAAHAAGFADQAHFSRKFREMFGLSPSEALSASRSVQTYLCEDRPGGP